jgi:hypothetical protein
MKFINIIVFLFVLIVLSLYLAMNHPKREGFQLGTSGIAKVCDSETEEYSDTTKCYDVSYIDPVSSNTEQVKAQIENGYYIDSDGFVRLLPFGYVVNEDRRSYRPESSGISKLCTPDMHEYTIPNVCYSVKYVNPISNITEDIKAQIKDGYYIDSTRFVKVVPSGYIVSEDKLSYKAKSKTAMYEVAAKSGENIELDAKISNLQKLIDATTEKDSVKKSLYIAQLNQLQKRKIELTDETSKEGKQYNPDNFDITYHPDPTKEDAKDSKSNALDGKTLSVGKMWIKDKNGDLKAVPYNEVLNTTLYYPSGIYTFNPPPYIPNYEESIYLSKLTNDSPFSLVEYDKPKPIFQEIDAPTLDTETKCSTLDNDSCKSSTYCVLFGGEKCVAGDISGPTEKSNYSDITIINRDYYYYNGGCYGNCV